MSWRNFSLTAALGLSALLGAAPAHATTKAYQVGHFSDEFYATVAVEETNDVFKRGVASVYARKRGQRLLRVEAPELAFDIEQNGVSARSRV